MTKKTWIVILLLLVVMEAWSGHIKRLSRKGYNILVLHSYNSTYVWSEDVTEGIRDYFEEATDEKINLYLEFLDAKRYPGESYLQKMNVLIEEKYNDISDIHMIIASDNQALSFMMNYGRKIFPEIPVVFCGINYLEQFDFEDFDQYTGVNEAIRPDLTVEQIIKLQPEVTNIFLVSDCNTKTGVASIKQARKLLRKYSDQLEFEYPLDYSMPELEAKLRNLDDNYAVLLLIYNLDRVGDFFEVEEAVERVTEAARVPVYACWDFYFGNGVIGGAFISGYTQGRTAAELALQILHGKKPNELPIVMESPISYKFDQAILDSYQLKRHVLPSNTEYINQPQNYLLENWKALLLFVLIVGILTVYIFILLRTQRSLKLSKQSLKQKDFEWNKLAGSLPGMVFRIDSDYKFIYINSFFQSLLRMTPRQIIGKHLSELKISKDILEINQQALTRAMREKKPQRVEFKYGAGQQIRAFETMIQPEINEQGEVKTLLGIVYDLSDRYKTEQQLKNSEIRAKEARRIAKLGYWEIDLRDLEITWSYELSQILGITHEPQLQDLTLFCQMINQPKEAFLRELQRREMTGELNFNQKYKIINAKNEVKYLQERGEIIVDRNQRGISVYGTIQDVTTERQAEQQIRASEAKFRALFNHAPIGISLLDENLNFVYYNPTFLSLIGYNSKEADTVAMPNLIHPDDKVTCLEKYRKLFAGELNQFTVRKRILGKNGKALWTLTTVTNFFDEEENKSFALSMELDIHNQVIAEEMVAESQQLLVEAQQIAKFGYWKYDPIDESFDCSEELLHILGYEKGHRKKIRQEEFVSFIDEALRDKFVEQLHHSVVMTSEFELAVPVMNMQKKSLQANIRMVSQDNEEETKTVLGTFIDITVMKSIESQLRQMEARFRLFFENSPLGILILDDEQKINLTNPASLDIFDLQRENIIGSEFTGFVFPEHQEEFSKSLNLILSGKKSSVTNEFLLIRQDKGHFWCSLTMALLESDKSASKGVMLMLEDINEKKLARQQLKQSEEKYRSVFEVSRDGLFLTNETTGEILELNSAGAKMFGFKKSDLVGSSIYKLAAEPRKLQTAIADHAELVLNEWGKDIADNRFPMEISLNYFKRNDVNYHVASVRNITERLNFQAELRDSEKKFRTIIENAPIGIIFVDENNKVIFSNQVILRMLKYEEQQSPEKLESLLFFEEHDLYRIILEDIFSGERSDYVNQAEISRIDHSTFWGNVMISVAKSEEDTADYAIIMIQDITETREVEEKLHLYEKLESIGQLAGMIAHDFNNQLMGVLGYATILSEQLEDEQMREYARMIYNSAEASADLTQNLLSFARKGRHITINQNFHKLIQETLNLVRNSIQSKIKINLELQAKNNIVPADPGQVQNALLNLIINSCDAMPDGGTLTIKTANIDLDDSHSLKFFEDVVASRYLRITVSDTGLGMSEETKKHIFEPFFTTKEVGKGTGLGLPAVYGTVKSHQGYLDFSSEPEEGTTFELYFPLAEIQVEEEASHKKPGYSIHGTGNIVVIDDEEIVRKTVKALLESLGYHVQCFVKGGDALDYFKENFSEIDLVLLDVIMPEMDGPQVFEELKAINPKVKVLFFSAYSATKNVQNALDNGALGFIQKPILRDELSQKISQALADQRINHLRSLFGIEEGKRVDINQEMIIKLKDSLVGQFDYIIDNITQSIEENDSEKCSLMLRSLDLFVRKSKFKSMSKMIKDLKIALNDEPSKALDILSEIQTAFRKQLD